MKNLIFILLYILLSSCRSEPVFATQTPAANITAATTTFTHCLGSSDTNVQAALNTLDSCTGTGGTPGGVNTQFQINNSGVFGGGNMYNVSGNVGINSTAPGMQLDVQGTTRMTGFNLPISPVSKYVLTADNLGTGTWQLTDAANVSYHNVTYTTVQAALDFLLYISPVINTFTNNQNIVEIGLTISSTILNWTVNKTMTTESLNQGIGAITPPTLLTYTDTNSYTTSRTYTLTVGDGTNTTTANSSVTFENKVYFGVNASNPLSNAQILALSQSFSTTRVKPTFSLSPSAQYIYYCYPASFGAATFTVNGFLDTDFTQTTVSFTNASGHTSSYFVYNSNQLLTGTYTVAVS